MSSVKSRPNMSRPQCVNDETSGNNRCAGISVECLSFDVYLCYGHMDYIYPTYIFLIAWTIVVALTAIVAVMDGVNHMLLPDANINLAEAIRSSLPTLKPFRWRV